jgi:hypothetical protein
MMPYVACTGGGNQARQGLAGDARERKVDDVRIAEKIVEKRLDSIERIRPAKLKKNDP